jgi:hypothetical protein
MNLLQLLSPRFILFLLTQLLIILAGSLIISIWDDKPIAVAIGTSIAATGGAGLLTSLYYLMNERRSAALKMLDEFGLIAAFDRRGAMIADEYRERLTKARKHIDIIGYGLNTFLNDFRSEFSTWRQHAEVRILLLDPEFPDRSHSLARMRDGEEGRPPEATLEEIRSFVDETRALVGALSNGGCFAVRLYKCIPTLNVFRIDDDVFWGPYLIGTQSRNNPTFIARRGGLLYDRLVDHFETIWSDRFSSPA